MVDRPVSGRGPRGRGKRGGTAGPRRLVLAAERRATGGQEDRWARSNRSTAKVSFPELEERILAWWDEAGSSSGRSRCASRRARVGLLRGAAHRERRPGIHHVEPRTFKDVYPRYKTMTGHQVRRKGGWDCHGLPVELEVEKEIGTTGKRDIEAFGVAEFNAAVPRVGPALRRRVRAADRAHRLLDRHVRRLLDDGHRRTSSRSGGR